jgi:hypothetical protein
MKREDKKSEKIYDDERNDGKIETNSPLVCQSLRSATISAFASNRIFSVSFFFDSFEYRSMPYGERQQKRYSEGQAYKLAREGMKSPIF